MIEIELKARVKNPSSLIQNISGWAQFQRCCHKNDTYWADEQRQIQLRIRGEKNLFTQMSFLQASRWPSEPIRDGSFSCEKFFPSRESHPEKLMATYKRKELVSGSIEVNQENEFYVEGRAALEVFLQDAGFIQKLKKEKLTVAWTWEDVTLELCYLPELGNFLELEILREDESDVGAAQQKLKQLLTRCGIEESDLEGRFYSELLQEIRGQG